MTLIIVWLASIILSAGLLSRYNKAGIGFLSGLFFGPIGVLFALAIRSSAAKAEEQARHEEQMKALQDIKAAKVAAPPSPQKSTRRERACPYCAENILAMAKICKHCNRDVEPLAIKHTGINKNKGSAYM